VIWHHALRNALIPVVTLVGLQAPVLFQIANDLSRLEVKITVDEADIGQVREGQSVRFTVDAFPDDTFTGVVTQVRKQPETESNVVAYIVIAQADNPDGKLMPGMTANADIVIHAAELERSLADHPRAHGRLALELGHRRVLTGDSHDLFGDGSVEVFATPGHTCGHQSLRVRRAGGHDVLAGDACYFCETLEALGVQPHPRTARSIWPP